jgi:lysophospholipase L1-like esterase
MKSVSRWLAPLQRLKRLRDVALAHWLAAFCLGVLAVGVHAVPPASGVPKQPAEAHWVAAWAVAPLDYRELAAVPGMGQLPGLVGNTFRSQTLRQLMEPALDGEHIRIRFSNRFGKVPLRIAAASVARGTGADAISPTSLRILRFGGRSSLTVAPGADVWSDGVDLKIEAGQTVTVSTFLDGSTPAATVHMQSSDTSWVVPGNAVATPKLHGATPQGINHIVTGLDVLTSKPVRTVVAFGDSITAGGSEAREGAYPDLLATRLRGGPETPQEVSVVNMGIGGNRLLLDGIGPSGLSRFARDALGQSSVTHVIVLMGTNDIGRSVLANMPGLEVPARDLPTAERITEGLAQLVKQARAKGVKVLIGTVPPFKNTPYFNEGNEVMRNAVNRWIRSLQDVDGVIDFDAALRDPADPQALNPQFDKGDHLHPNMAGHAAMSAAIDLKELKE